MELLLNKIKIEKKKNLNGKVNLIMRMILKICQQ